MFLPNILKRLKLIVKDYNNNFDIIYRINSICQNTNKSLNQKTISNVSPIAQLNSGCSFENRITSSKSNGINYIQKDFYDKVDSLFNTLIKINRIISFNIIFDDIEDNRVFKLNDCFSSNLVEDFILIVNELNNKFSDYDSRIFIVIRDDVLDLINSYSNNINKIIEDHSVNVNWINGYNSNMPPLIELIISKIINNNEILKGVTTDEFYRNLLPKQIGSILINNYIINATFGRPRDVVVMFKKATEISKGENKFTEECFKLSRKEYSEYFLREIKNELSMIIEQEDLDKLFLIFKSLNDIDFNKNQINEEFVKYNFSYFKDIDSFLLFCFEKSIIGIKETDRFGKSVYKWKYRNSEYLCVNNDDVLYTLHRGISKAIIGK